MTSNSVTRKHWVTNACKHSPQYSSSPKPSILSRNSPEKPPQTFHLLRIVKHVGHEHNVKLPQRRRVKLLHLNAGFEAVSHGVAADGGEERRKVGEDDARGWRLRGRQWGQYRRRVRGWFWWVGELWGSERVGLLSPRARLLSGLGQWPSHVCLLSIGWSSARLTPPLQHYKYIYIYFTFSENEFIYRNSFTRCCSLISHSELYLLVLNCWFFPCV